MGTWKVLMAGIFAFILLHSINQSVFALGLAPTENLKTAETHPLPLEKIEQTCEESQHQLQDMLRAQDTLLKSMLKKNDSFAGILDQYASELVELNRKVGPREIVSLRSSAKAFRKHKEREQNLINRFGKKSFELVQRVNECLTTREVARRASETSDSNAR